MLTSWSMHTSWSMLTSRSTLTTFVNAYNLCQCLQLRSMLISWSTLTTQANAYNLGQCLQLRSMLTTYVNAYNLGQCLLVGQRLQFRPMLTTQVNAYNIGQCLLVGQCLQLRSMLTSRSMLTTQVNTYLSSVLVTANFLIYQPILKIRKSKQVRFAPESVWCDFFFTGDINKLNTSNRVKVGKIPKFGNLNLTVLIKETKIKNGYFCSWKIRHQWDYRKKNISKKLIFNPPSKQLKMAIFAIF